MYIRCECQTILHDNDVPNELSYSAVPDGEVSRALAAIETEGDCAAAEAVLSTSPRFLACPTTSCGRIHVLLPNDHRSLIFRAEDIAFLEQLRLEGRSPFDRP